MNFSQEQKDQFNRLLDCRDEIVKNLFNIEQILKQYFPEEFNIAYQFWIPQITTALYSENKWLNRGERNMQQTIDRLMDKIAEDNNKKCVSKYIE